VHAVPARTSPRRRALSLGLRAAIGGVGIAVLLVNADLQALKTAFGHVRPGAAVLAFALLLVWLAISALRWQVFLQPVGLAQPMGELLRLTLVGNFFNVFLPTGVGGDAYKAFRLRGEAGSMAPPLATVFLDRLAGLVGLAFVAEVVCIARLAIGHHDRVTLIAGALALAVLAASGFALMLAPRLASTADGTSRLISRIRRFAAAFAAAGRSMRTLLRASALGVASALVLIAVAAVAASSLGIRMPVWGYPGVVMLSASLAVLPISMNGLGLREAAIVWCLAAFGIGHDEALAFALLLLALTFASSAVGGVVYVGTRGSARDRLPGARQDAEDPRDAPLMMRPTSSWRS
jgi:glycosyltransferase 2 family protein